ncbi:hypothetical protein ATCV1_z779R [Acanthocystis turfacea chlorella virus 1]|uniref:Uncharacterized protein z779R n=1 Tax=Chlorovirus heliozoae TaxID=322019 RepID=A7KA39_9PHYC|nr:hypothetical protein ATCV1_z779R [Acanthocystis turfacea chlorella virus 1]ABT16913.1 hypothetical protein ATCV1_z779R [Acanthocystis turfacea chlorella virus 1]
MFFSSELPEIIFSTGPRRYLSTSASSFRYFPLLMFSTMTEEFVRSAGRPNTPKYFSRKLSERSASFSKSLSVVLWFA